MAKRKRKSLLQVIFEKIVATLLGLFFVFLLNLIKPYIHFELFDRVVELITDNLTLLLIISTVFFAADIFLSLPFPLDLPAPLLAAVGAIVLFTFLINVFHFVDEYTGKEIFKIVYTYKQLVYIILFGLMVIFGYIDVFAHAFDREEDDNRK